jgi:hypothetical protein
MYGMAKLDGTGAPETTTPETEGGAPGGGGPATEEGAAGAPGTAETITIGTVETDHDPRAEAGGCGCDSPATCSHADAGGGGGLRLALNLGIGAASDSAPSSGGFGKADLRLGNGNIAPSHVATMSASADAGTFGTEFYQPRFEAITIDVTPDNRCLVNARLVVRTPYGVSNNGRRDVSSASSDLVNATTFQQIAGDLRPDGSGRARRDQYFSQSLTERHERFHATDDYGWTERVGLPLIIDYLSGSGRTVPDGTHTRSAVERLMENALDELKIACHQYYVGGGSNHDTFAGENRAYAEGKDAYQELADAVERRGMDLITGQGAGGHGHHGGAGGHHGGHH